IPLPYDQRLDIVRSYLGAFGITRHRAMHAARKAISHHTEPSELREPENEELSWERLGLSPEEAGIFKLALDPSDSLDEYFGFPTTADDAAVINHMGNLPGFLEKTELGLEEAREFFKSALPPWLPLHTNPGADQWECLLPSVVVHGLNTEVLHRLHRYLRLGRLLAAHYTDSPSIAERMARLSKTVDALQLYFADAHGWKLNDTFLWELATLQKLSCTRPMCWHWWEQGLDLASKPAAAQRLILAGVIDLAHAPAGNLVSTTSEENWTTLEKLCAIAFTGKATDANRDPVRRMARLVEIANKIRLNPQLSVPELDYLFWEEGFNPGPPPLDQCWRAKPKEGFEQMCLGYGRTALSAIDASLPFDTHTAHLSIGEFVDWAWQHPEFGSKIQEAAADDKDKIVAKLAARFGDTTKPLTEAEMLESLDSIPSNKLGSTKRGIVQEIILAAYAAHSAGAASSVAPGVGVGSNIVADPKTALRSLLVDMGFVEGGVDPTPASVIIAKLDLIVNAVEPNPPARYEVPFTVPGSSASHPLKKIPFVYAPPAGGGGSGKLGLVRPATEEEIIFTLKWIEDSGGTAAQKQDARNAVVLLCQQPLDDLLFLRPLYPNQRELSLTLVDDKDPRTDFASATRPEAQQKETRKWAYLHAEMQRVHDTMIGHFVNGAAALGAGAPEGAEEAIVKDLLFHQLLPFGNPAAANEVKMPNLVWRDLLLPRGTGLLAEFWEYTPLGNVPAPAQPVGNALVSRREADLVFTKDKKYLGTAKEDGAPYGWTKNSPWPLLLPSDHIFKAKGNPRAWRARWQGRIYLPSRWRTKKIWLGHNLEPLNDDGFKVSIRPVGAPGWQVIDDWKIENHELVITEVASVDTEFCDVEVQFYDNALASDDWDAKFALCVAVVEDSATPTKDKFKPIPGSLYFHTEGGSVVGLDEFNKSYQRTWKAVYYTHALR
ncbi:MAG: hypothetical protein ACAH88_12055, partial [Roseimicrobium sp.]